MATPKHIITRGNAALRKLQHILPPAQAARVRQLFRGEEGEYFVELMESLVTDLDGAPVSYQTDGQKDSAKVILHYFTGSSDWWITELDAECDTYSKHPEYPDPDGHRRAFGFVCLNGDTSCAESGYVSLPELFKSPHVELDFHWDQRPLHKIKASLGLAAYMPDDDDDPESQAERSARPEHDTPDPDVSAPPPERSASPSNIIHLPGRRRLPSGFRI
jgi:hypothetical protein